MPKGKIPLRAGRFMTERLEQRRMLAADLGADNLALDPFETTAQVSAIEVPSIDGTGNNIANPALGAADTPQLRLTSYEYADGLAEPAGGDRPSARQVSNEVAAQAESIENDRFLTDFVWLWGQFIDHDIVLTHTANPAEGFTIEVPTGDAEFDPAGLGEATIDLTRSQYVVDADGVRQQVNSITAYIDGSAVYGSDEETAASLRTFEGGRLRTSNGDLFAGRRTWLLPRRRREGQ